MRLSRVENKKRNNAIDQNIDWVLKVNDKSEAWTFKNNQIKVIKNISENQLIVNRIKYKIL